ncbi:hypothetical protein J2Y63_004190 [Shinella sp. BE166]
MGVKLLPKEHDIDPSLEQEAMSWSADRGID